MCIRDRLTQCDGIIHAIQSGVLPNGHKMVVETTGGLPYLEAWDGTGLDDDGSNNAITAVSYTHLRAHETVLDLVCRLLLEKKTQTITNRHTQHK